MIKSLPTTPTIISAIMILPADGIRALRKIEDGVKTGTKPKCQAFPDDLPTHQISILERNCGMWLASNSFMHNDLCVFARWQFLAANFLKSGAPSKS